MLPADNYIRSVYIDFKLMLARNMPIAATWKLQSAYIFFSMGDYIFHSKNN